MLFPALTEVLDPEPHSAALNMAIDEVLLRTARKPMLRVYRWERPAVSFGYFGKWAEIAPAWPGHDLVRRWTGGGVVEHGDDLTYTLIVPREHPFFALPAADSYRVIHEVIAGVFAERKKAVILASAAASRVSNACFENAAQHDLLTPSGRKIAGAAQRRTREGLLHQGSIQAGADSSAHASALAAALGFQRVARDLPPEQLTASQQLAREKYGSAAWLRRF